MLEWKAKRIGDWRNGILKERVNEELGEKAVGIKFKNIVVYTDRKFILWL